LEKEKFEYDESDPEKLALSYLKISQFKKSADEYRKLTWIIQKGEKKQSALPPEWHCYYSALRAYVEGGFYFEFRETYSEFVNS